MNIYAGLLFLHGHIADVGLAQRLAERPDADAEAEAEDAAAAAAVAAGSVPATHGVALPPVSPHPCG